MTLATETVQDAVAVHLTVTAPAIHRPADRMWCEAYVIETAELGVIRIDVGDDHHQIILVGRQGFPHTSKGRPNMALFRAEVRTPADIGDALARFLGDVHCVSCGSKFTYTADTPGDTELHLAFCADCR